MNTVTLDGAGRVVIPKVLREELGLEPGDMLDVHAEGELLTLRPVRAGCSLQREQGVWVFRGSKKLPASATNRVLHDLRDERDRSNRGGRL